MEVLQVLQPCGGIDFTGELNIENFVYRDRECDF